MLALDEIVAQRHRPIVFYEIIPPPCDISHEDMKNYVECAVDLIKQSKVNINAINIPEIHDESRESNRTYQYSSKADPRVFSEYLCQEFHNNTNIIINHCSVHESMSKQQQWLQETIDKYKINNMIIVGGESSKIKYPGPSVTELSKYIKQHHKNIICGGISIPCRIKRTQKPREPEILLKKSQAGIEYFTTQIIYDQTDIEQTLFEYDELCRQNKVAPKRIILSFAPVSNLKDIEFLKWLGVSISDENKAYLAKSEIAIGWRSLELSKKILRHIIEFASSNAILVPLGINIEHINLHNFVLSKEFIEELGEIYLSYIYKIK